MKKTLALLMLAAMLLSTGCGNNAMDGAKKDAQEAAQKVEEKANEAKDAASAKVDKAKDKADEIKQDAAAKVDEMTGEVEEKIDEVSESADRIREAMEEISFEGIAPGFSLDEVKAAYGEPVSTSGEELIFENGAIINVDSNKKVKSVRLTTDELETPAGISVGMSEYALNDVYGTADAVKQIAGGVEYEYHFGKSDASKLIFTTNNGIISEIKSEYTN